MKRFVGYIVGKCIRDWEDIHNQDVRSRYGLLEGWISIFINFFLFLLKTVFGFLTGSVSLIADGFHTLSDVVTSIVIVASFRIARKPSDAVHPFGHGRMESVATLVVAVLLIVVGIEIFKNAFGRILHPRGFNASWLVIGMIFLTVVTKELLARFSRELGRIIDSAALEADFWHHRTDAVSSVLVIAAFVSQRFGFPYLDGPAGIVVAGMIVYTGWRIAKKGIDDLLGKQPSDTLVQKVKTAAREFPDVLDVHDLIVHQYGQTMVLSFHIEISDEHSLKFAHTLAEQVEKSINEKFHAHATVHIDPVNTHDPEMKEIGEFLKKFLDSRQAKMSFHDLRTVGEDGAKNLLFDLAIDPGMRDQEVKVLEKGLRQALLKTFPSLIDVIIEVEPRYAV